MPKTIHNSRPCSCCHRLMPIAKAGKRPYCSERCRKAQTAQRSENSRARKLLNAPLLPMKFHGGLK